MKRDYITIYPSGFQSRTTGLIATGLLSLSSLLSAQETETDDTIFEISPFVIQEGDEEGYIASSTLAGTRLRSSLQDIGASVQVITSEFLDDIGATEANDLLLFTTGTETFGLGGNFSGGDSRQDDRVLTGAALNNPQSTNRVRGLGAPDNTRDFFITDIPFDSYNTGRVEINRGANAILFGLGSPSGVLNAGLNKAIFDETSEIDVRVQDGGKQLSTRGSVDFNRVLIEEKLAVRFSAMQADRNYSQEPSFQDQERYYVATTYVPFENTTIRANYENGHIRANSPDPVGPLQAIDEYLRERDRYHAALRADTTPANQSDTLPLIFNPWLFANRGSELTATGVDNYDNILANQGFGQSLGMVWGRATPDPDYGFVGVIPAGNISDLGNPGFQHPVFFDAARPADGSNGNPRAPRAANFRRVDNLGARNGVYEGFVDLELFNFAQNLLSGPVAFQNRDFDAYNISLEQTFWDNKAGFELAYAKQNFKRENFNGFPGRTMGLMVDINTTLPDGRNNPNLGRPFMVGKATEGRFVSDRETFRWTGFGEFNTADIFGDDSLWSTILGRHVFTGLASRQELQTRNISYSLREFGPREANLNENFGTNPDARHFDYLVYMGPAVDLVSDPAGITRNDFKINPITVQNVWNPTGDPVPTTYFDTVTQQMVTFPIERRLAAINGELNGTVNDSLAVIMQSFLLDENIVGTLGWRQDEVTNNLANTPLLLGAIDQATLTRKGVVNESYENTGLIAQNANGDYLFEDPVLTVVKEDIFSWGAVAKLPQKWNPFEWLNHASLFYSSSSNFQPAPGREDHLGRQLPSPTGTTEDFGINLSFLDDKFNVRLNRFEAAINNADNPGVNRVFAQASNEAVRGFINNFYNALATENFDELEDLDPNAPEGTIARKTNIPKPEAERLLNEYMAFLGVTVDRFTGNVTLDTNNPRSALWVENGWRAEYNEGLGVVDGIGQTAGGKTDTVDQVSKGYELEMVANPMKGLRVLFNVAKVETANSNIAPIMRAWIEEEFGPFHAGTPTNPSVYGRMVRGIPTHDPAVFPGANTNVNAYTNDVVRDWEVIKAQEGTFTPEVRKWRYNAVVNYDFQEGFLKGFGTGVNVRYQSRVAIGFPISLDAEGIPKPDIANPFYGPSEIDWGFRFAYTKRIWDNKVRWRVQLNLSNVFSNEEDLIPVRMTDTGALAQVRTSPPKGWVISNTFNF